MNQDKFGKYRILGRIGQGAMGEVFKGEDEVLGRFVAVKVMAATMAGDSDLRARFLREAQSAARLNHPNIITVYDFGEESGRIYMAMELLEGRDLKDLIKGKVLGDAHQKLEILEQICSGLAFAHASGIFHRDLKPANIHIQPTGQVKIMDFGLARLSSSEMTRTGMVMGTPHYMSPEQVRGEKVDARSDVFSLGAVLYELLSGRKPFDGDSMHTILFHVMQDEPEPLSPGPELPPILIEVVEKALAKDPTRRFQSGAEFLEAVQAVRRVLVEGREAEATLASELGLEPHTGSRAPGSASWVRGQRRVLGNVALDSAREPASERTKRPARTMAGSPTHVGGSWSRAAERSSRLPLIAGVGAAVVATVVMGFVALRLMRPAASPAGPPPAQVAAREQIGALSQALAGNQVELAEKRLEDKDYRTALERAERALKLDPQNAGAQRVLQQAQGALRELETAARESRSALEAQDTRKAAEGLWRVLSIDPNDAAVESLSAPLDGQFRSQAEEARRLMGQARAAAVQAKAGSLEAFTEADKLAGRGDGLFAKGLFAQSARQFLAARDGFERARRLAER